MDEVYAKRETVLITKHGKPVWPCWSQFRVKRTKSLTSWQVKARLQATSYHGFPRRVGRTEVILVDTHVVVWLAFDPHEISRKAKQAIEGARENGEGLAISDITLLELATLVSQGRIRLDISIESFLQEVESRFVALPMNSRVCARAITLPGTYPKIRRTASSEPLL